MNGTKINVKQIWALAPFYCFEIINIVNCQIKELLSTQVGDIEYYIIEKFLS
jgi:hypothetical protein